MQSRFSLAITFIASLILSGCNVINLDKFIDLKKDVKLLDEATTISGTVVANANHRGPILVALYKKDANKKAVPAAYAVVYGKGSFQFLTGPGSYYLIAFEDKNEDFTLQKNEHLGWYGAPNLIEARPGVDFTDIVLKLHAPGQARRTLPQFYASNITAPLPEIENQPLGKIVAVNDPRFSQEVGELGMWNPVKFLQQGYSGVYFLEAYDPAKIPVLFIHGISGSGANWRTIISRLDRKKYQPWIVQYPSGMRLELVSSAINQAILQMQLRYKFKTVYVIAHSMGGLVARGFINKNLSQSKHSPVRLFVSISTPWMGSASAASGLDYTPVVVPSWYDMAAGSNYIDSLFVQPLPDFVPHYLIFGHRGGFGILNDGNSDGVVSLRSQLPLHVQESAEKIIGYDEGHSSILRSRMVARKINEILDGERRIR